MGFAGGIILKPAATALENMGIDDAVGAVTAHGTVGSSVCQYPCLGAGMPALQGEGAVQVSVIGQLVGAVVFFLLGFVPGYVCSLILKIFGLLRVKDEIQVLGLDLVEVPRPEGISLPLPE